MGEGGRSAVDEVFSKSVDNAAPLSFLTLEFLCARKFSGLIQKNFAEVEGVFSLGEARKY